MKSFIATVIMIAWSAAIAYVINTFGFIEHEHNWMWSLGAAIVLVIGLVGNIWIFLAIVKDDPWRWFKSDSGINQ